MARISQRAYVLGTFPERALFVLGTLAFLGCSNSRIDDLERRVALLESSARPVAPTGSEAASASAAPTPEQQKLACNKAKSACLDAWDAVLPGAEGARNAAGKVCRRKYLCVDDPCPCMVEAWKSPGLLDGPKAAREGCSLGAFKAREGARAVADDPSRPEVLVAKKASETMFEACRETEL